MNVLKWVVPSVLLGLASCSVSSDELADPAATGTLSVALVGRDGSGQQYRLRNATFLISGYPDYHDHGAGGAPYEFYESEVSTETDLDAAVVSQRVVPGYYYVEFQGTSWYLERLVPSGPERIEQAVLLSERTQYTRVYNRSASEIYFRFGVDGELIDFRYGDLNIGIRVETPSGAAGAAGSGGEAWGGPDWDGGAAAH